MQSRVTHYLLILFSFLLLVHTHTAAQRAAVVAITNPNAFAFVEKVVEIPWTSLRDVLGPVDTSRVCVVDGTNQQLPVQLQTGEGGKPEALLVQLTVPPHKQVLIRVKEGKRKAFPSKAFCRFVPERYDDFAWENDRIAFRMYGKALEATTFNAYGIDVWAKRTTGMVINNWYKKDDYHNDHGEGLDFYGVGYTLGAGGSAPYLQDSIWYSKDFTRYEVLDNGPLRCRFRLFYEPWPVAGKTVEVTKTITLDAGEQLSRVEVVYQWSGEGSLPVAIGINKKGGQDVKYLNRLQKLFGYWLPPDKDHGTIGVGVVLTTGTDAMKEDSGHLLAVVQAENNKPLVYYTGAAWDKAGRIKGADEWFLYLQSHQKQLASPVKVVVRKSR
jgi:hypothetical protein